MADPLSIAASIVALMGAVSATTKVLEKVIGLRDTPDQVVQLIDEVADIESVLVFMSERADELDARGGEPGSAAQDLAERLGQAKITLERISSIMETKIIVNPPKAPGGKVGVSKLGWLKYEKKLRTLLEELRHARHNMHSLVSTHTGKALTGFRLDLQDIALLSREISANIRGFETVTLERLDTISTQLEPVDALHSTLRRAVAQSTTLVVEAEATGRVDEESNALILKSAAHSSSVAHVLPASILGGTFSGTVFDTAYPSDPTASSSRRASAETLVEPEVQQEHLTTAATEKADDHEADPDFLIKATIYRPGACSRLCACRCHSSHRANTPAWAVAAVGNMFLGYSGSPLVGYRTCSDLKCQQNGQKALRVSYYFPRWFLDRMVELTCSWGPMDRHRISIRAPRLVAPNADIFAFAIKGNIQGLRMLFQRGEASPFDINALNGRSALNLATNQLEAQTCRFLLDAGADPHETDQIERSPIDIVWNIMIREGRSPGVMALLKVFKLDLDDGYEYLMTRKYPLLHQIVMELKSHPGHDTNSLLALQLSLSTEDMDAQDLQGRTPLHWAAIKGNPVAIKLLLDAGASIEIRDYKKQNAIQLCALTQLAFADCLAPLLHAAAQREWEATRSRSGRARYGAAVWKSKLLNDNKDYQGRSPAHLACYCDSEDKLALLLSHEADIELADGQGRTPLLYAIFRDAPASVSLLLDNDARTEVTDKHGSTILHYAARYGTLRILRLLDGNVRGVDTRARDKDGFTATQVFSHHRMRAPGLEETSAFHRLLANAAKLTRVHARMPGWAGGEDWESSGAEQFFTAASSLEASLGSSLDNSVEDLLAGKGEKAPPAGSGVKPLIRKILRKNKRAAEDKR